MKETEVEKSVLLIGGGGHCHSVIDSLLSGKEYDRIAIVDPDPAHSAGDISVIGTDDDLPQLFANGWTYAFVTVGSVGNTTIRRKIFNNLVNIGFSIPSIIDPTAAVALDAKIGSGVFVGKNAVINAGTRIEDMAIINSGAIVDHDCYVKSFAHISPGAVLCGQVEVGEDSHVGAGSVVKQQVHIGNSALIGAGSVVVKDIPDGVVAYGNPCKVVK